jgi:hypothetical protein
VRPAGGGAEPLSGCYLSVEDDLDPLLAEADHDSVNQAQFPGH